MQVVGAISGRRHGAVLVALLAAGFFGLSGPAAAAGAGNPPTMVVAADFAVLGPDAASAVQQAVDDGVANAADGDISQAVTVIDRATGTVLASSAGDRVYNSESIVKLFTAAYYLIQADGQPDAELTGQLEQMIVNSDDSVQSALWDSSIIPTMVDRYGLTKTRNANNASSRNWGSGKITADDEAGFLYQASVDPLVGPLLMSWMSQTAAVGSDGFNQAFGLNALTGDHGSKQGWSDPGWSPYNTHSVGWTGQYIVAILQNSYSAGTTSMRATSTYTATAITTAMQVATAGPAPAVAPVCAGGDSWLATPALRKALAAIDAVLPGAVDGCASA